MSYAAKGGDLVFAGFVTFVAIMAAALDFVPWWYRGLTVGMCVAWIGCLALRLHFAVLIVEGEAELHSVMHGEDAS